MDGAPLCTLDSPRSDAHASKRGHLFDLYWNIVSWIAPRLVRGMRLWSWAVIPYLLIAYSNYLADTYESRSSSAQAAQSFTRNISSGMFPILGHHLVGPASKICL